MLSFASSLFSTPITYFVNITPTLFDPALGYFYAAKYPESHSKYRFCFITSVIPTKEQKAILQSDAL